MTTAAKPRQSKSRTSKASAAAIEGPSTAVFNRCIPPDVDCELTPKTRAFVLQLFDRIEELTERLEKLEKRLAPKPTPQNSSLPPSSAHPQGKPKSRKPKSQRKQGGQRGHKRHTRPLIPTEHCDHVEQHVPTQCRCCQQALIGTDLEPWRHQVSELPPIKPIVTEYQLSRLYYSSCGITTCGAFTFLSRKSC